MSDSLWPHGLYCPWNSPGQNTGVGSLYLLQGIFSTQGSNPGLPHCRQILYELSHQESPINIILILHKLEFPTSSYYLWGLKAWALKLEIIPLICYITWNKRSGLPHNVAEPWHQLPVSHFLHVERIELCCDSASVSWCSHCPQPQVLLTVLWVGSSHPCHNSKGSRRQALYFIPPYFVAF